MIPVASNIETLVPYKPGRSIEEIRELYHVKHIIKLASNENPLGPSPKALEAAAAALKETHLYPRSGLKLRERLAELYELLPDNVMAGAGSESILLSLIRAYVTPEEEVLTAEGTFIAIYVMAKAQGVGLRTVPLKNYRYDLDALADAISPRTKLIYFANPNNPTGTIFTRKEFERFIERVPEDVLVVFDEAYFEYASQNPEYPDSMNYRRDNVVTLRTFSKAYGIAGMRIGYGFAHADICETVRRVKLPFDPAYPSEMAGIGALDDREFLDRTVRVNAEGRKVVPGMLESVGLKVVPTEANFYMIEFPSEADALHCAEELLKQGVIVRPLGAFRLPKCLRMTIGTPEEMNQLADALKKISLVGV